MIQSSKKEQCSATFHILKHVPWEKSLNYFYLETTLVFFWPLVDFSSITPFEAFPLNAFN